MANKIKRYETFKCCTIYTHHETYSETFSNDWTFSAMKDWLMDTFCINEDTITEIECFSKTIYKREKPD